MDATSPSDGDGESDALSFEPPPDPLSLDAPNLPGPVRAALEAAATIDALAVDIDLWDAPPTPTRDAKCPTPPDASPNIVQWFRRSFLASTTVLERHWCHGEDCRPAPHPIAAFKVSPYLLTYVAASATSEYDHDDDLQYMLPQALSELLVTHDLASTLRCGECRAVIRRHIAESCLQNYRGLLLAAGLIKA